MDSDLLERSAGRPHAGFFVAGGTLGLEDASYVVRQADADLLDGLLNGEFCYVLDSRQVGKSSLMIRTMERLRERGVAAAHLDLTQMGNNLTVDQWYYGLLHRIGKQVGLQQEAIDFWRSHRDLGPMQRWVECLEQLVLPRLPNALVVFVDEIDVVQNLAFSTDEFFAGIRECYTRRVREPGFERLSFCLIGTVAPTDLIRSERMTPFNIGRRIELRDFTAAEAAPLAVGLDGAGRNGARLLQRVLYWTGGHPYLTQRLCASVAEIPGGVDERAVDRLCRSLFLSPEGRDTDNNLTFVRKSILEREGDRNDRLDLYRRILGRGRRVTAGEEDPLVSDLRLAGIVRVEGGRLRVRNRIYARVFDRTWIAENMPDAELRRQRAAYRRGLLRTAAISCGILAVVAGLGLSERTAALRAWEQQSRAEAANRASRQLLYAADMSLAQSDWEQGRTQQARALLDAYVPHHREEDLRTFEWRYFDGLCRRNFARYAFPPWREPVDSVAVSPDGRLLIISGRMPAVHLLDLKTRRAVATFRTTASVNLLQAAFSPDGRLLAAGGSDKDGAIMGFSIETADRNLEVKR